MVHTQTNNLYFRGKHKVVIHMWLCMFVCAHTYICDCVCLCVIMQVFLILCVIVCKYFELIVHELILTIWQHAIIYLKININLDIQIEFMNFVVKWVTFMKPKYISSVNLKFTCIWHFFILVNKILANMMYDIQCKT